MALERFAHGDGVKATSRRRGGALAAWSTGLRQPGPRTRPAADNHKRGAVVEG